MKNELVTVSNLAGQKVPTWVQGAGGNFSVKEGEDLWIKATGFRLDQVNLEKGLAVFNWTKLREEIRAQALDEGSYSDRLKALADSSRGGRPSMEAGFHVLFEKKWVFHFHSLAAVLMAHDYFVNGQSPPEMAKLKTAFLPPVMPGLTLAYRLIPLLECSVVIMQNHGVILAANEPEILQMFSNIEQEYLKNRGLAWDFSIPCPRRFYFPDTAIYWEKIDAGLAFAGKSPEGEELFHFTGESRDAREIWSATQALYKACPNLDSLPQEILKNVAHLPTEVVRRKSL